MSSTTCSPALRRRAPRARAAPAPDRTGSALPPAAMAAASSSSGQSITRNGNGCGDSMTCSASPPASRNACAAFHGERRDGRSAAAVRRRRAGLGGAGPPGRCRSDAGPASRSRNQSRCCANEAAGAVARGRDGSVPAWLCAPRSAVRRARPIRDGLRIEQHPHRHVDAERLAQPRDHLRGQQRVAAQRRRSSSLPPTCGTPSTSDQMAAMTLLRRRRDASPPDALERLPLRQLRRSARRSSLPLGSSATRRRPRKRAGIMTAGSWRARWVRTARPRERRSRGHHEADQARVAARILLADHRARDDGRVLRPARPRSRPARCGSRGLHLMVDAPEELDRPVRQAPRQVPVRYSRAPGARRSGSGRSARPSAPARPQIAARQRTAADVQLARHADRHRLQPRRSRRTCAMLAIGRPIGTTAGSSSAGSGQTVTSTAASVGP